MLLAISALKGFAVEASDGVIGTVGDVLFDDRTWRIRWLVIDTGAWLSTRKVLIHPSSVDQGDYGRHAIRFALTMAQIEASPDISSDEPVSQQLEDHIYDYYGWEPNWGDGYFGIDGMERLLDANGGSATAREPNLRDIIPDESGDSHLRSVSAVTGYHIKATDGEIGHVENFLVDDEFWEIRYLIADTRNWWPGKHVLLSPYSVHGVDGSDQEINVAVTRAQVKASPPWEPAKLINQAYEEGLHRHYN